MHYADTEATILIISVCLWMFLLFTSIFLIWYYLKKNNTKLKTIERVLLFILLFFVTDMIAMIAPKNIYYRFFDKGIALDTEVSGDYLIKKWANPEMAKEQYVKAIDLYAEIYGKDSAEVQFVKHKISQIQQTKK